MKYKRVPHNAARNRDKVNVRIIHTDQLTQPVQPYLFDWFAWAEEPVHCPNPVYEISDNLGNYFYTDSTRIVLEMINAAGQGSGFLKRFCAGEVFHEAMKNAKEEYRKIQARIDKAAEDAKNNPRVKPEIDLDLDDIEI